MYWSFHKLNLLRFSGVSTVLGIDMTGERAKVVELNMHGGLFSKFQSAFTVKNYFTVSFQQNSSLESKASELSRELQSCNITAKYAASTIQSLGVRTVTAEIPAAVSNIDEWIRENHEKLLKIPVPLNDIAFSHEILRSGSNSFTTEITFVRKADIESEQAFFASAGLTLLSLTGGVRDALNVLLYNKEFLEGHVQSFGYITADGVTLTEFENNKRLRTYRSEKESVDPNSQGLIMAGEVNANAPNSVQPFSIPPDYALAVGCALKGFIPELYSVNLLPSVTAEKTREAIYKNLFQRTVFASGGLLLGILLLQLFVTLYIDNAHDELDVRLLESGLNYTELRTLERQNTDLKNELQRTGSSDHRSNNAKIYHDIAGLAPEGLWLYRVSVDLTGGAKGSIQIAGYALSGEKIAEFLQRCERNALFLEVRLTRSGVPLQNENVTYIQRKVPSPVTFELRGALR